MGLRLSGLAAINPRLIMIRVSGYGQTGPYAKRAGFGAIGEAMGGLRYIVGDLNRRRRAWDQYRRFTRCDLRLYRRVVRPALP